MIVKSNSELEAIVILCACVLLCNVMFMAYIGVLVDVVKFMIEEWTMFVLFAVSVTAFTFAWW